MTCVVSNSGEQFHKPETAYYIFLLNVCCYDVICKYDSLNSFDFMHLASVVASPTI